MHFYIISTCRNTNIFPGSWSVISLIIIVIQTVHFRVIQVCFPVISRFFHIIMAKFQWNISRTWYFKFIPVYIRIFHYASVICFIGIQSHNIWWRIGIVELFFPDTGWSIIYFYVIINVFISTSAFFYFYIISTCRNADVSSCDRCLCATVIITV